MIWRTLTASSILFLRFSMTFTSMMTGLTINMMAAIAIITTPATTADVPLLSNDFPGPWCPAMTVADAAAAAAAVTVAAVVSPVAFPSTADRWLALSSCDGACCWAGCCGCCTTSCTWFRPLRSSIMLTVHQAITCDTMTRYLANVLPSIRITLAGRPTRSPYGRRPSCSRHCKIVRGFNHILYATKLSQAIITLSSQIGIRCQWTERMDSKLKQ